MPNWFGEALFATPMLRALRSARPQAFIAALGVPRAEEVLRGNPCLETFVPFDPASGGVSLVRRLRALQFETAIILRRSLTRSLLLYLAGIPVRIGFSNRKSGWLLTHRVPSPDSRAHKAHTYLSLLGPLGVSVDGSPQPYEYYPTADERGHAARLLRDRGVANPRTKDFGVGVKNRPMIVLHPGANWFHKRWATERFARLADRLGGDGAVVITGGPEDRLVAHVMANTMTTHPIILAGQTTLRQLAACLEQADVVVSNDTGVLHIASALRRPIVALYGPTSPALTGPLGDPARTVVIHHPDCCPSIPCFNPHHPEYPGMDAISVDEVYGAAKQLLENSECGMRNAE